MIVLSDETCRAVVRAIEQDLRGRAGIGNEWDQIDEETLKEIRATWAALVKKVVSRKNKACP